MSAEQKRWICHDCGRQYINPEPAGTSLSMGVAQVLYRPDPVKKPDLWDTRPWEPANDGCYVCGSSNIELVEYRPADFPGGDIAVDAPEPSNVVPFKSSETPAPLPLVAETPQMDVSQFI